jgi:hypothetical protein
MWAQCTQLLEQAVCSGVSSDGLLLATNSAAASDEDDGDFFNLTQSAADPSQKHLQFLNDTSKEMNLLEKHPQVKQLFIRYNTCIPSSAHVERLFSAGSLIMTKRRNRLSDKLFETLLMLKINKHYW